MFSFDSRSMVDYHFNCRIPVHVQYKYLIWKSWIQVWILFERDITNIPVSCWHLMNFSLKWVENHLELHVLMIPIYSCENFSILLRQMSPSRFVMSFFLGRFKIFSVFPVIWIDEIVVYTYYIVLYSLKNNPMYLDVRWILSDPSFRLPHMRGRT